MSTIDDDLRIIQGKWSKLLPLFGGTFLEEIAMCNPISIIKNCKIQFEFCVLPEMCDNEKKLHGGSAATILDSLMAWAMGGTIGDKEQHYVTVDLALTYFHPMLEGEKIIMTAEVFGRNDGFTVLKGQLERVSDETVCVHAKQTMMHIGPTVPKAISVQNAQKINTESIKTVTLDEPTTDQHTTKSNEFWQKMHSGNLFTKYPAMWTLISAQKGSCIFEIKVTKAATNALDTVHGGFLATSIQACTSATTRKDIQVPRVSIALHVSYLAGSRVGDILQLRTKVIEQTEALATIYAVVTNKLTGVSIASGYHLVSDSWSSENTLFNNFVQQKSHL